MVATFRGSRTSKLAFILACCALLGASTQIYALSYFVHAQASASVSGTALTYDEHSMDTGQVQALSISTGQMSAGSLTSYGTASASASGSVEMGHLHGAGSFSGTVFTNPNLAAAGSGYGQYEQWSDTFTITSNTLAPGTPVQFLSSMTVHRTLSGTAGSNVQMIADTIFPVTSDNLRIMDSVSSPDSAQTVSKVFSGQVGQQFTIMGQLYFNASGTAFASAPASGTVDVSNTADFTFQPITAGASYTTASGASYVPEPGMAFLLALSLPLLHRPRRRR